MHSLASSVQTNRQNLIFDSLFLFQSLCYTPTEYTRKIYMIQFLSKTVCLYPANVVISKTLKIEKTHQIIIVVLLVCSAFAAFQAQLEIKWTVFGEYESEWTVVVTTSCGSEPNIDCLLLFLLFIWPGTVFEPMRFWQYAISVVCLVITSFLHSF